MATASSSPTHRDVAETFVAVFFLASMAIAGWHLGGIMANPQRADLILNAQRAGYHVTENEEGTGWLVVTPRAPRRPSQTLGDYVSSERAWMGAALLAQHDNPQNE